jgi:hypothetical protein
MKGDEKSIGLDEKLNIFEEVMKECTIDEVIDANPDRCYITLLGSKDDKKFVMKIKKKEYMDLSEISNKVKGFIGKSKISFNNDIYFKFIAEDVISNEVIFKILLEIFQFE